MILRRVLVLALGAIAISVAGQANDPGPVPEGISEGDVTPALVARGDALFNSGRA